MPRFVVVGNLENRRISYFRDAVIGAGFAAPTEVSYVDLLAGRKRLGDCLTAGTILRIESPGENFEVEQALLRAGVEDADAEGSPFLCRSEIDRLEFDRGLILHPRQWYLGFCRVLRGWAAEIAEHPGVRVMNPPQDIAVMFNKPACHARLAENGVPVPTAIANVSCYEELLVRMAETGTDRVFVKLAHGSSASGVVAFQQNGDQQVAITSAELVRNGKPRLYNSLKIRLYTSPRDIAALIDTLCLEQVHVERWLPKLILDRHGNIDVRVVAIGGQARHWVIRQSRSPLTNLHLGNRRGDREQFLERLGKEGWQRLTHICQQAMRAFSKSLYAGIDLLVMPDLARHAVLEVNAFGDLLPHVLDEGLDTYSAEVVAVIAEQESD